MKTLRLELAHPGDSPKVTWQEGDRAVTSWVCSLGRALSVATPLPGTEHRLAAKRLVNRYRKGFTRQRIR